MVDNNGMRLPTVNPRPTGVSRRKSSNLLASLGRQNTMSDKDKDKERDMVAQMDDYMNNNGGGIPGMMSNSQTYNTPRRPSASYAGTSSSAMASMPSSSSTIIPGGSTTPTHASIASRQDAAATAPNAPTAQNTPSSQSGFGVALENLREMLERRASTFNYLKRAQESGVHWFNTILLQREDLDATFSNTRMSKR